jgi:uncharacterized protein YjbJ (UPF0337 family)
MTDTTRDRIEGTLDEAKGRGKAAWGEATDDDATKAEGEGDQLMGKLKQDLADAKDTVGDAVDKVTGNDR